MQFIYAARYAALGIRVERTGWHESYTVGVVVQDGNFRRLRVFNGTATDDGEYVVTPQDAVAADWRIHPEPIARYR